MAEQKKTCNSCGSATTQIWKGREIWHNDFLYQSLWLCNKCFSREDYLYLRDLRTKLFRIKKPRWVQRKEVNK